MKVLFLLFFLGVSFAPVAFADADENAAISTDHETAVESCPEYSPPMCAHGQKIALVNGGNGCKVPVCASPAHDDDEFQPEGCPSLVIPKCGPGQELKHHTDFNRCPYSLCEDKK